MRVGWTTVPPPIEAQGKHPTFSVGAPGQTRLRRTSSPGSSERPRLSRPTVTLSEREGSGENGPTLRLFRWSRSVWRLPCADGYVHFTATQALWWPKVLHVFPDPPPNFRGREFFQEVDHPSAGRLEYPGAQAKLQHGGWRAGRAHSWESTTKRFSAVGWASRERNSLS